MSRRQDWVSTKGLLLLIVIGIFTVIILSSSLFPLNFIVEDSVISQALCNFPCWRGLVPGHSTKQDILKFLEYDAYIYGKRVKDGVDGFGRTVFRWHSPQNRNSRIIVENDIIYKISIYPNFSFTLEQTLAVHGLPDGIFATTWYGGGPIFGDLYLLYPKLGSIIYFSIGETASPDFTFTVKPTASGIGFTLYKPANTLEEFINSDKFFIGNIEANASTISLEQITRGWPGFGTIVTRDPRADSLLDPPLIITPIP